MSDEYKEMLERFEQICQNAKKELCIEEKEKSKDKEIERINNKYRKALELLIDYNLPCEVDDFMNVHSNYCETHCGVDEEQYKRCWNKYIEWKIGSDKE